MERPFSFSRFAGGMLETSVIAALVSAWTLRVTLTDNRTMTGASGLNCWMARWADISNWRTFAWFHYNNRVYCIQMSLNETEYISKKKYKTLTLRRWISMPNVSVGGLNFSDLAWMLKLLWSKNTDITMWHARPFANTLQRPAYCLIGW